MNSTKSFPLYLVLFALSALALVLTGAFETKLTQMEVSVLSAIAVLGTIWIYAFNAFDLVKQQMWPALTIIILSSGMSIYAYSIGLFTMHRIFTISFIFLLGLGYSMPIKIKGKRFRVKELAGVKNIFIGLGWGALVLFGGNSINNELALGLALFTFIQIATGSSVRDVFDIERDQKLGITSLPMLLKPRVFRWTMHSFNIISILLPMIIIENHIVWFCMMATAAVRALVIEQAYSNRAYLWTQPINILCPWVLLFGLILFYQ